MVELDGGMQGVVDLFDEGDELADVVVAKACPWIVAFELLDQPLRVIDADAQLSLGSPKEGAGHFRELRGLCSGQGGQLAAAGRVDETVLEVDADAGISSFEQRLDFAEERLHPICGRGGDSRCSNRLARSFKARRASRNPSDNSR